MRHRVAKHYFGRNTNQRKALLLGLVRSMIEQGAIVTTRDKALETKRILDKLIHKAQSDTVANRRLLHRFFGKKDVVNTLVERIAPSMSDRVSGFTTLVRMGNRRGDNAQLVKLALVVQPERKGTLKNDRSAKSEAKKNEAKVAKPVKKGKTPVKANAAAKTTRAKVSPAKSMPERKSKKSEK